MKKSKSLAVVFGSLGCLGAILSIIGCVTLGINREIISLLIGIIVFILAAYLKNDIVIYISYACYLVTLYLFISDELFYIANEIQGIDSAGLSVGFILGAGGLLLAIIFSMIGSIFTFKKQTVAVVSE